MATPKLKTTVKAGKTKSGGWMDASPMAYVGLIVGVISIITTLGQWFLVIGDMQSKTQRNYEEIARNFKEDEYHRERQIKATERIDNTISGLTQVHVKIGQLETQLSNITELLKRVEARLDRTPPGHHQH